MFRYFIKITTIYKKPIPIPPLSGTLYPSRYLRVPGIRKPEIQLVVILLILLSIDPKILVVISKRPKP